VNPTVSQFAAWRSRWVLPYMATLAIVVPILIFFAALPASAPRWLRHLHPDEDTWRWVLWGVAALLAVNLVVLCLLRVARDDRDFVLGP
jgi:hypothetical protein